VTSLRILVYPHAMELGGSQLNALELAGAVRDLGHEVTVLAEDGPLLAVVERLGLKRLQLDARRRRPSLSTARRLRNLIGSLDLDIVHGYEWPPGVEAAAAAYPGRRAAAVCTVMSSAVAPFLPVHLPLVVGTRALQEHAARRRPGPVHLIEPPVDVVQNAPGHPVDEFRAHYGLADDQTTAVPGRIITVGVVCRLVPELKLEGILTAIDAIAKLARERPIRLVIAGDGDARSMVEQRAAEANAYAGWRAVVLTGQLLDPRPVYAAADVMLGMGGSALRALAFGKPLVVQGERGFWELLTPDSSALFLHQGWYGLGDGTGAEERLATALRRLLDDPALRAELGLYGRSLVVERFSLQRAAAVQTEIYLQAIARRRDPGMLSQTLAGARSAAGVFAYIFRRRFQRLVGTRVRDDFNAVTLAAAILDTHSSSGSERPR
jgi:glycosyltransferase involved in cell wall biosynthesis